jgi:hypothetical protein
MLSHDALNVVDLGLPTRGTHDDWDPGASASLGVFQNRVSDGKVDGYITTAQRIREVFDAAICIVNIECQSDLMALLAREFTDEPAHSAISDECDFHWDGF